MSIADKIKDKVVDIGKKYLEEKAKSLSSETKFLFEMWEEMGELSKLTKDDISVDELKKKALDLSSKIFKQINIITVLTTEASKNHAIDNDFKKRLDTITSTLTEITKDTKVLAEKSGVEKTVLDVVDTLVVVAKTSGDLKSRAENLLQLSQGTLFEGKNDPALPEMFTGCLDDVEQSSDFLSGAISGFMDIAKEEIKSIAKDKLKDTIQEKLTECIPNLNRVTGMVAKAVATAPVEIISDKIVSLFSTQTESIPEVTKPVVTHVEINEEFQIVFEKQNETADFAGNIVGNAELIKEVSNTIKDKVKSNFIAENLTQIKMDTEAIISNGSLLLRIAQIDPSSINTEQIQDSISSNSAEIFPSLSSIHISNSKITASQALDKSLTKSLDQIKAMTDNIAEKTINTAEANNADSETINIIRKQIKTAVNIGKVFTYSAEIHEKSIQLSKKHANAKIQDLSLQALEMDRIASTMEDITKSDPSFFSLNDYQNEIASQSNELNSITKDISSISSEVEMNETNQEITSALTEINERNSKTEATQKQIKAEALAPPSEKTETILSNSQDKANTGTSDITNNQFISENTQGTSDIEKTSQKSKEIPKDISEGNTKEISEITIEETTNISNTDSLETDPMTKVSNDITQEGATTSKPNLLNNASLKENDNFKKTENQIENRIADSTPVDKQCNERLSQQKADNLNLDNNKTDFATNDNNIVDKDYRITDNIKSAKSDENTIKNGNGLFNNILSKKD